MQWTDIGTQPIYSFTFADGNQASLSWRDDHIYVNGYFDDTGSIAALAEQLHARLVGDDEEEYHSDGSTTDWIEDRTPLVPPAGLSRRAAGPIHPQLSPLAF